MMNRDMIGMGESIVHYMYTSVLLIMVTCFVPLYGSYDKSSLSPAIASKIVRAVRPAVSPFLDVEEVAGDPEEFSENLLLNELYSCVCLLKRRLAEINHEARWSSLINTLACEEVESPILPITYPDTLARIAEALTRLIDCIGCCGAEETVFSCLQTIKELCGNVDEEANISKLCVVESQIDLFDQQLSAHDVLVCSKNDMLQGSIDIIKLYLIDILAKLTVLLASFEDIKSHICDLETCFEMLDDCEPIVITAPRVIGGGDPSGRYCLANDIDGTITISRSNVLLDLNSHRITHPDNSNGVFITDEVCNVTVCNGDIVNSDSDSTASRGILCDGSFQQTAVSFYNLVIKGETYAIEALDVIKLAIERVGCIQFIERGISLDTVSSLYIQDCYIHSSHELSEAGIAVGSECSGKITTAIIQESNRGIWCSQENTELVIQDSYVNGSSIGLLIGNEAIKGVIDNLVICNCSEAGLQTISSDIIVQKSAALFNDVGFEDVSVDGAHFYNNVACDNGTNYSANIILAQDSLVTSPQNVRGFANVDCDNSAIDQIDTIESKICLLESMTDIVSSQIDNLEGCGPTPITAPVTIDSNYESGVYCLANDINGTIVISRDNVVLDLNGHVISSETNGVIVDEAVACVTIKNGTIRASTQSNGVGILCTSMFTQTMVNIENILCQDWLIGINTDNVNSCFIRNVRIISCDTGILMEDCVLGMIAKANILLGVIGCAIRGSTTCLVDACIFNDQGSISLDINSSSCLVVRDCLASGYKDEGTIGFYSSNFCSELIFNHCFTCNYNTGYYFEGGTRLMVLASAAMHNDIGFFLDGETGAVVIENNALFNQNGGGGIGFLDETTANHYYNNIACDNDTNYSADIVTNAAASVTSPQNARGFDNVDCSDTTENTMVQILDKLCSYIDLLIGP
ncbi:MAG: right-handed parallel beta-helix repeat-containing protein [Candidatus Babeliales bacterium]